jgi:hypothetical protein
MKTLFRPSCSVCGNVASSIEILAPNELPTEWDKWDRARKKRFQKSDQCILLYKGPGGSSGDGGTPLSEERAAAIVACFSAQPTEESMREADIFDSGGFCFECSAYYCPKHWSITATGSGTCPNNHWKSLDPHWSPD